jgi:hypothetical protein
MKAGFHLLRRFGATHKGTVAERQVDSNSKGATILLMPFFSGAPIV